MGLIFVGFWAGTTLAAPGDWMHPNTFTDVSGVWTAQVNAYDPSVNTYASCPVPTGAVPSYGGELRFNYTTPLLTNSIRVMSDFGYGTVDSIRINVLPHGGAWTTVYTGAVLDGQYSTIPIPQQQIDSFSFTYHFISKNYTFWLYDIAAMQVSVSPTPPVPVTQPATSVSDNAAVFHGLLQDSGGALCQMRFEYGTTTGYGQSTPWVDGYNSAATADVPVGGLAGLTTYHFRAEARQGVAGTVVNGLDAQFTTGPIPDDGTAGWVTAIISSDSTGGWFNLPNVRDDNDATYAQCQHQINSGQPWSPYIYLQTPPVLANGLRVVAPNISAEQTQVRVDISSAGAWVNVYQGPINGPLVVAFGTMTVSNARVGVNAVTDGTGFYWQFDEFDFRASPAPPPRAISDLTAVQGATPGTITLTWTAPGDYGNKAGTAAKAYDIRYSIVAANSPALSNAMFNAAASVAPGFGTIPTPSVYGTPEMMTLTGLTQGTTYYFAIKARNEIPYWSSLSNGATNWAQIAVRGVTITEASYAFGSVPVGTSTASITAVHVTNSGTIATTYTFSAATSTVGTTWSLGAAAPGPDVVVVSGAFHGSPPTVAQFGAEDVITGVSKTCTAAVYSVNGSQTGVAVPVAGVRLLWFKLAMPTTSSSLAPGQDVTVTVTAGP